MRSRASFVKNRAFYVCFLTPTMHYQLLKHLLADVSGIIGRETCPLPWAFEIRGLLRPHPCFFWPPSSIKQVFPFTSDLIRLVTFALLGWIPGESLLHLVLCCWLHLPTGIAPTHACLCPSAIPSDFVQLVNLASSPCWELRRRKGRRRGNQEEKVEKGG